MINILGTDYKIKENCNIDNYSALKDNEAYTDHTTKEIIISIEIEIILRINNSLPVYDQV